MTKSRKLHTVSSIANIFINHQGIQGPFEARKHPIYTSPLEGIATGMFCETPYSRDALEGI